MTVVAVLCYVVKDNRVLLIRKKRGFGVGKLNAPGGRVESGETFEQAAIRECEEETGVRPLNLEYRGFVEFYSVNDEPDWVVHVFVAKDFRGELRESDEAKPVWCKLNELPYEHMWEDDYYWLPYVLHGKSIKAKFWYDENYSKVLRYEVEIISSNFS